MSDMRKYKKPHFISVDDLINGPRQMRIAGEAEGQFQKPDLVFENGDKLGLSGTNLDTLAAAYGWNSNDWLGHVVELSAGELPFKGEMKPAVIIRTITKANGSDEEDGGGEPTPTRRPPDRPPELVAKSKSMDFGTDSEDPNPFGS
jgi:hypothetical protein